VTVHTDSLAPTLAPPTSRREAALIVQLFSVIDRREWARLDACFHPEVVYERPGYPPFEGLDRLRRFYEHERIIISGTHHLAAVVADGDQIACHGRFVGTLRDGSATDEAFADFYRVRDGLVVYRRSFFFRPAI
jgi:ketosteroid isomerase-like protein